MTIQESTPGFVECRTNELTVSMSITPHITLGKSWGILDLLTPGTVTIEGTPNYFQIMHTSHTSNW